MEKKDPNLIFNYENIFYSFYYDDEGACIHRSREFALNYVCSGEMVLDTGGSRIHAGKGECVFIPRDHHITMYKRPLGGERYCGIFMSFTRSFLKEMYSRYAQGKFPADTPKLESGVIKLPDTAEFRSLFSSLSPFLDPEVRPRPDFMQLKLQEGLLALLHTDRRFAPTLFDFNEAWKIDLLDFMESNYTEDLTLDEFASYTGRSLATFKRDFAKISTLSPQRWITERRLEEARRLLLEGGVSAQDVCYRVGFKNRSHFSQAFKKRYGCSPLHCLKREGKNSF